MKKSKKIIIAVLCLAMLLPLTSVFVVKGEATAQATAIAPSLNEDFENKVTNDLAAPHWEGINLNTSSGGGKIDVAPDAIKSIVDDVEIPRTKAISSYGGKSDYGQVTVNENLPTSTAEVRFDVYITSCSWKGVLITIGNGNTKHSAINFFRPSGDSQYSSYGNSIVASYSGSGGTAPTFHPAYVPIAKENMPNGEYMETGKWYNIRIVLTSGASTAKFYIDGVQVATIPASSSVSLINSIRIQRVSDGGGNNEIYVDNIAFYAPSSTTPYYFEDFEDYTVGGAPTDVWTNSSYNALTIGTLPALNQALYLNKPHGAGPSTSITFTGALPTYTNEISFDAYIESADYKGIVVDFYSGSDTKPRLIFYGASNYSSNSAFKNKVMLAYWDGAHQGTTDSYDRRVVPALDESEVFNYNEWNSFTLKWNKGDSVASLYINGKLVNDSITIPGGDVINKISILPMNSDGYGRAYFDNIRIYGDNSDVPYYSEDFSSETAHAPASGWTTSGTPTVAVNQIKSYPSHSYDVDVEGTNALHIYQNGTNMVKIYRVFKETNKMSISFDYLPTIVSTRGSYLALFAGETQKFYLRVYKADTSDETAIFAYDAGNVVKVATVTMNKWINVKIEFENNVGKLYIDGKLVADKIADKAPTVTSVDRMLFGTISTQWTTEDYYVDNINFTGIENIEVKEMTTEFTDNFNSENTEYYSYSGSGSHLVEDGKLVLNGNVSVTRRLPDNTMAGKFGFTVDSDDLTDLTFDVLCDNKAVISMKIGENGAIYYKRTYNKIEFWNIATNLGVIESGKAIKITLDLPDGRNANYANVTVDGEQIGTVLYDTVFSYINGIRITTPDGADVLIDDVYATKSAGIVATPDRGEEKDPIIYVPEIIEGTRAMYYVYDSKPQSSTLLYADENPRSVALDYCLNSIGVDLGSVQRANGIRIIGDNPENTMKLNVADINVWYSNDNKNWDRAYGHTLNVYEENGISSIIVEFTGIEARYIKINYNQQDGPNTILPADLDSSLRVERKIIRQWGLASTAMYVVGDTDPTSTPMTYEVNSKTTDGKNKTFIFAEGNSVGLNFGLQSNVEAIEIVANGLSSLGKNAFKLYYSYDNCDYYPIDNVILSRDEKDGMDVYRLTFENVKCAYLKLYNVSGGTITLDNLYDSLSAYSSIEVASSNWKGKTSAGQTIGDDGGFYVRADGTLVMSFAGFPAAVDDYAECYAVCIQSTDGGYTWSDTWVDIMKRDETVNLMTQSYIRLEDGSIGVIYSEKLGFNETNTYVCRTFFRRSYDEGRTWTEPVVITENFNAYAIQASGYRFTRLSNGRIIVPINYSCLDIVNGYSDAYGDPRSIAFVMYSDDDGATWHMSNNAVTTPTSALEPVVTETADGMLLMTLRVRNVGKIYQSLSIDGGLTWSQPHELEGIVSPSSTNIVDMIPQTGDVIFVWNNEFSTDNGRRNPLTMALSSDNGLTYKNIRNIRQGHATYPFLEFWGRSVVMQSSAGITVFDIADVYHTIYGNTTVEDLAKATTPNAKYSGGWLTGVSSTMKFSLDGGESWTFCGGTSVEIGDVTGEILVMDIGTHEYAPSDVQIIK